MLIKKQRHERAAIFGILIGYFIGREHIKYELRAAIEVATDGIRRSFGGVERKPQEPSEPPPFTISLTGKIFREADFPKVQAATVFGLTVDNLTGKDIRAFDGRLMCAIAFVFAPTMDSFHKRIVWLIGRTRQATNC